MIGDDMGQFIKPEERDLGQKFPFVWDALFILTKKVHEPSNLDFAIKFQCETHISKDDIVCRYPVGSNEQEMFGR